MCVILTSASDARPSLALLKRAEARNQDGGGVAWSEGGKVHFRKGISADEVHTILQSIPKESRWVAHFRISTVGGKAKELCHPFPISPDSELSLEGEANSVLFHNGHVSDWKKYLLANIFRVGHAPRGEMSDSRALAWLCHYTTPLFLEWVNYGRFAVLDGEGRLELYPNDLTGWYELDGVDTDILASNSMTSVSSPTATSSTYSYVRNGHVVTAQEEEAVGKRWAPPTSATTEVRSCADSTAASTPSPCSPASPEANGGTSEGSSRSGMGYSTRGTTPFRSGPDWNVRCETPSLGSSPTKWHSLVRGDRRGALVSGVPLTLENYVPPTFANELGEHTSGDQGVLILGGPWPSVKDVVVRDHHKEYVRDVQYVAVRGRTKDGATHFKYGWAFMVFGDEKIISVRTVTKGEVTNVKSDPDHLGWVRWE